MFIERNIINVPASKLKNNQKQNWLELYGITIPWNNKVKFICIVYKYIK